MSSQHQNVDQNARDKENLAFFETLLRHLQRIPDNKILLFRQEVDALLLKYAHHYVQNNPVVHEPKRKRQETSSESETDEEPATSPAAKSSEKKKSKAAQKVQKQKQVRRARSISSSDEDEIKVVKEIRKPITTNVARVKPEQASKNVVKMESDSSNPAPTDQFSHPTGAANYHNYNSNTPGQMQQVQMSNASMYSIGNNQQQYSSHYGHPSASNTFQHRPSDNREMPAPPTQYQHPASNSYQQAGENRPMPPQHNSQPPVQYGSVASSQPSQQSSQNSQMPPQNNQSPTGPYGHAATFHSHTYQQTSSTENMQPQQYTPPPSGQYGFPPSSQSSNNFYEMQVMHKNQQHPPQYDNLHGAPSTSTHSVNNEHSLQDQTSSQVPDKHPVNIITHQPGTPNSAQ